MPEICEVARIQHLLDETFIGKKITKVTAKHDTKIFNKPAATICNALEGRTLKDTGRRGKILWLVMDKAPHLIMQFGGNGRFYIKGEGAIDSLMNPNPPAQDTAWPPEGTVLQIEMGGAATSALAFVDKGKQARLTLVDCAADDIKSQPALKDKAPDPVLEQNIFTLDYLASIMGRRAGTVKKLINDQKLVGGLGMFLTEEVLRQADMDGGETAKQLKPAEVKKLYITIEEVCTTAVAYLGDPSKLPSDWTYSTAPGGTTPADGDADDGDADDGDAGDGDAGDGEAEDDDDGDEAEDDDGDDDGEGDDDGDGDEAEGDEAEDGDGDDDGDGDEAEDDDAEDDEAEDDEAEDDEAEDDEAEDETEDSESGDSGAEDREEHDDDVITSDPDQDKIGYGERGWRASDDNGPDDDGADNDADDGEPDDSRPRAPTRAPSQARIRAQSGSSGTTANRGKKRKRSTSNALATTRGGAVVATGPSKRNYRLGKKTAAPHLANPGYATRQQPVKARARD